MQPGKAMRWVALAILTGSRCSAQQQDFIDEIPVTLRPRTEVLQPMQPPPQLRVAAFQPQKKLNLFAMSDVQILTRTTATQYTLEHKERFYVDMESIEPWLHDHEVRCHKHAMRYQATELEMTFSTDEAFAAAQDNWGARDDLMFVVEGADCFEAAGFRSFYKQESIKFVKVQRKAIVSASPLPADAKSGSGYAHLLRRQENLSIPEGYVADPRPSSEIQDDTLQKRNFPDINLEHAVTMDTDLGERHDFHLLSPQGDGWQARFPRPYLACLNCHARGKMTASASIDFNLLPDDWNNDPVAECIARASNGTHSRRDARTKVHRQIGNLIEATRMQRHYDHEKKALRKRSIRRDVKRKCDIGNLYFPKCELEQQLDCFDKADSFLLHPLKTLKKFTECTGHTFKGDGDCWRDFLDEFNEFDGFTDYAKRFAKAHVRDASISLRIDEPVDIRVQLEVDISGMVGFWYDVDICKVSPGPGGGRCSLETSFGAIAAEGGSSPQVFETPKKDPKKAPEGSEDKEQKPHEGSGDKEQKSGKGGEVRFFGISAPVSLVGWSHEFRASVTDTINITFPGFQARMNTGSLVFKPLEDEEKRFENSLTLKLDYLPGNITLENPSLMLTTAGGPKVSISILPAVSGLAKTIQSFGLGEPMVFGAHFQPVRFDMGLYKVDANDARCSKRHPDWPGGIMVSFTYRLGLEAYVQFFIQRIDTNWVGMLDHHSPDATPGLWKTWTLGYLCFPFSEKTLHAKNEFSAKFHRWFNEIQEPFADAVKDLESWVNHLGDHNPDTQSPNLSELDQLSVHSYLHRMGQNFSVSRPGPAGPWSDPRMHESGSEFYGPSNLDETLDRSDEAAYGDESHSVKMPHPTELNDQIDNGMSSAFDAVYGPDDRTTTTTASDQASLSPTSSATVMTSMERVASVRTSSAPSQGTKVKRFREEYRKPRKTLTVFG